jgi:hypothetical protein
MSDQKLIIGYYRLSMEDDSEGESNSIINQRKLVKDYISNIPELASMPFQEFYDDGYSGSSMERPAIKQVLELARENKVQCIVVKDFSRFARNYIEMGTYLEQIFPFLGVRFIGEIRNQVSIYICISQFHIPMTSLSFKLLSVTEPTVHVTSLLQIFLSISF